MNATCERNHLLADDGRCHVCEYAGPTAELQSRADRVGPNGDRPARPFSYRTLTEIVQNPIPAPPIQIDGLCREGELFILTGPADRLKSTTIAELAVCIASGRPVFDRFRVLRPGKALIIQNEIHPGVYDERMLRYREPGADWLDKLLLISPPGLPYRRTEHVVPRQHHCLGAAYIRGPGPPLRDVPRQPLLR